MCFVFVKEKYDAKKIPYAIYKFKQRKTGVSVLCCSSGTLLMYLKLLCDRSGPYSCCLLEIEMVRCYT